MHNQFVICLRYGIAVVAVAAAVSLNRTFPQSDVGPVLAFLCAVADRFVNSRSRCLVLAHRSVGIGDEALTQFRFGKHPLLVPHLRGAVRAE